LNGYIHPHINRENICWGNIGPTISRLLGQLELHGLFQMVHQFLITYNPDDPYQRIERWDPNWEDEDEDSNESYCVFCDEFGHEVSDCEFSWWCEECEEHHHIEDGCPQGKEVEAEVENAA